MNEDERYERDTREHIAAVQGWLDRAQADLIGRAIRHDRSKLEEPERSGFQAMARDNPLAGCTYGSPEYHAALARYPDAVLHHYAHNDHHPEHYPDGVDGMSLLSLLEMLCDWKAATARMKDGDLRRSIALNAARFGYGEQLQRILENTARELGML